MEFTGIFNGERMVTEDGRAFPVPENYASKSRLVVGDVLKLYAEDGKLVYKQIKSVERRVAIAKIIEVESNVFARVDDALHKILPATVSFYNLETDDEVMVVLPKHGVSEYAAVEGVLMKAHV